jgi:hypothetical protein
MEQSPTTHRQPCGDLMWRIPDIVDEIRYGQGLSARASLNRRVAVTLRLAMTSYTPTNTAQVHSPGSQPMWWWKACPCRSYRGRAPWAICETYANGPKACAWLLSLVTWWFRVGGYEHTNTSILAVSAPMRPSSASFPSMLRGLVGSGPLFAAEIIAVRALRFVFRGWEYPGGPFPNSGSSAASRGRVLNVGTSKVIGRATSCRRPRHRDCALIYREGSVGRDLTES